MLSQQTAFFKERCYWKTLGDDTKTYGDVTKLLNFIKQRPVHSKMFKSLSKHPDKEHISCYTQISVSWQRKTSQQGAWAERWIAGRFQENRRPDFAGCFEDEEWLQKLTFLADIFDPTSKVN